ncbi:MAG: WYL domain-containing protein, partial [Dehalococcoidia bacterium]|nr:WYL domain-containing protein [Dehalococcoidia bacterium]
ARAAAAKVESVLRPETRREVERLRQRISVSPWTRTEASPWLALLQKGVINDRVLWLRYHSFSSDEVTERKVEPYFLVYYSNDWHLVGYCRLREGMRDFRAGRIRDCEIMPDRFERAEQIARYPDRDGPEPEEVRVWLEASAVPWAREAPAFGLDREEPTEGGSVFVYRTRDVRRLLPWLLSWGSSARVLHPPELVERVQDEAQALARAYAEA